MNLEKLRISDAGTPVAGPAASRRGMLAVGAICFALGLGIGLFARLSGKADSMRVKTFVVRPGGSEAGKAFSAGGWIEVAAPEYPVIVSARISQRLEELNVKQGDVVKPDQVVARLYDKDLKSKKELAEAKMREAGEKLRIAKADYERSRSLEKGAISAEELDRDLAAFKTAEQREAAARAELDVANRELSYCSVQVPEGELSLRVLDIFHSPGSWVGDGPDSAIVSLYDPSNIQVRVDVPQTNIRFVKAGNAVEVRTEANPERVYRGTVIRVDPLAELAKNTVRVRIRIEDPDQMLFPEMIAHTAFLGKKEGASGTARGYFVPSEAVTRVNGVSSVFVLEDGMAKLKRVEAVEADGVMREIKSGLTGGQRVIISGTASLSDGQKVEEK